MLTSVNTASSSSEGIATNGSGGPGCRPVDVERLDGAAQVLGALLAGADVQDDGVEPLPVHEQVDGGQAGVRHHRVQVRAGRHRQLGEHEGHQLAVQVHGRLLRAGSRGLHVARQRQRTGAQVQHPQGRARRGDAVEHVRHPPQVLVPDGRGLGRVHVRLHRAADLQDEPAQLVGQDPGVLPGGGEVDGAAGGGVR